MVHGLQGRIQVNAYSERWLKKGFPWVYPKELVGGRGGRPGRVVEILGPSKQRLGIGLTDDGWLAARVFRKDGDPRDVAWLREKVRAAAHLRSAVVRPDTTAYRLIHGENDGLPGIRVDWWDGWITMVLDSPSLAPVVYPLIEALDAEVSPRGVYLCYRPDHRERGELDPSRLPSGWITEGQTSDEVVVLELGTSVRVRPWEGPDTGLYMDMREVRRFLSGHWSGRRVLNTFAYTGMFSVVAAREGATAVTSVDLSAKYLDRARANFVENGLDPDAHTFLAEDTFKALDRMRRKGEAYDIVILDPPSFSHSKEGTWSSKKDMPRLVAAAARVLAPGGWIVAASNLGQISPKEFRGWVADGWRRAGRTASEIGWFGAAPDFPAAVTFPEGHHLKVGIWAATS